MQMQIFFRIFYGKAEKCDGDIDFWPFSSSGSNIILSILTTNRALTTMENKIVVVSSHQWSTRPVTQSKIALIFTCLKKFITAYRRMDRWTDGQMDGWTTFVKIMITIGRDYGSALWINLEWNRPPPLYCHNYLLLWKMEIFFKCHIDRNFFCAYLAEIVFHSPQWVLRGTIFDCNE